MQQLSRTSNLYRDSDSYTGYEEKEGQFRKCCRWCGLCLHNQADGTFLAKRPLDWMFLFFFYIGFFTFLAAMYYGTIWFSFKYLIKHDSHRSTTSARSGPGLSFLPSLYQLDPLIWYANQSSDKLIDSTVYEHSVEVFLDDYRYSLRADKCANGNCTFDFSELGRCSEDHFGYRGHKPCVFIKLNKRRNWIPDPYKDPNDLPENMPKELRKEIIERAISNTTLDVAWLYCYGMTPADAQHFSSITYFPLPGFEAKYFPYKGDPDYKSPLVAIQFNGIQSGLIISVECRAWAKNLDNQNIGNAAQFQLYIHLD